MNTLGDDLIQSFKQPLAHPGAPPLPTLDTPHRPGLYYSFDALLFELGFAHCSHVYT